MTLKIADPTFEPIPQSQVMELLRRAEAGDREVLPQLREWLDLNPDYWRKAGDLARVAELLWIELVAPTNLANQESLKRNLAELRQQLTGRSPSALERLLADRAALGWLQVNYADASYARLRHGNCTDLRIFKAAEQRQERAQRRFLAAVKTLAVVQKLLPFAQDDKKTRRLGLIG